MIIRSIRRFYCSTIAGEVCSEDYIIKHSLFKGYCKPVESHVEAREYARELKKLYGSSHACWAFRGYSFDERANDDGEPKGTAGEPILRKMQARNIRNCVVVVTREFGGVKLGTGGLFSAYGKTAELALEKADLAELPPDPRFA
eukprot:TRINITY_DN8358_c0_g1_i1.p1 TRINITY_DN8358_c0_g1~~TRINITY_DN8358_c0_g1_i1.p1  ORF type:complete len:144 (+),score=7.17 TRINITY_DN8358_c0_g1_i1:197-628(+)